MSLSYFAAASNLLGQGLHALLLRSPGVHSGREPLPHVISVGALQLCVNFAQFGLVNVFETAGARADCESGRVIRHTPNSAHPDGLSGLPRAWA